MEEGLSLDTPKESTDHESMTVQSKPLSHPIELLHDDIVKLDPGYLEAYISSRMRFQSCNPIAEGRRKSSCLTAKSVPQTIKIAQT